MAIIFVSCCLAMGNNAGNTAEIGSDITESGGESRRDPTSTLPMSGPPPMTVRR
jgi:hypothetical protein